MSVLGQLQPADPGAFSNSQPHGDDGISVNFNKLGQNTSLIYQNCLQIYPKFICKSLECLPRCMCKIPLREDPATMVGSREKMTRQGAPPRASITLTPPPPYKRSDFFERLGFGAFWHLLPIPASLAVYAVASSRVEAAPLSYARLRAHVRDQRSRDAGCSVL